MQYDLLFSDNPVVKPVPRDYDEVVPHIYVVRINGMKNRQEIQTNMLEKGIEVGYHYQPNHWLKFFKNDKQKPLKVTDSIFPELLTLPLHPEVSEDDVQLIVKELYHTLKHFKII